MPQLTLQPTAQGRFVSLRRLVPVLTTYLGARFAPIHPHFISGGPTAEHQLKLIGHNTICANAKSYAYANSYLKT
jgi:hypothetical protein